LGSYRTQTGNQGALVQADASRMGRQEVLVVGASHKTAGVASREAITRFLAKEGPGFISRLKAVEEFAVLSTCNRVEFYVATSSPDEAVTAVTRALAEGVPLPAPGSGELFVHRGPGAIEHLFEVAAGLDSMVIGEPQILSQVRSAGTRAKTLGSAKGILSPLFDRAFRVGGRIRQTYRIEPDEDSLSTLAVDALLASPSPGRNVLLIGTGKMIQLAAKRLGESRRYYFATRRRAVPKWLSRSSMARYSDIPRLLGRCQVVISATSTRRPLVLKEHLEGKGPKVVVDLGMPRNVSPAVRELSSVRLLDLDDLGNLARARARPPGADGALEAARGEANEFYAWLVQTRLSSALAELHSMAAGVRDEEVRRALGKMKKNSPRDRRIVEAMARRIVSRLMARPTKYARLSRGDLSEEEKLELLSAVFGLGAPDAPG
jgi:glutamyl-tRNA reductase